MSAKPRLAVFKFASCDGCQVSLLEPRDPVTVTRRRECVGERAEERREA